MRITIIMSNIYSKYINKNIIKILSYICFLMNFYVMVLIKVLLNC